MTVADLDRLVSRTDLNPASKRALKSVRSAVMSGRCGDLDVGFGEWSVGIDSEGGFPARLRFTFKRD